MQATQDTTFNGWPNYETWCVNLWLTNEPGTYGALDAIAHDRAIDSNTSGDLNIFMKAEVLKDRVLEMAPLDGATMFVDLLQSALNNVDWSEIIRNHQED